MACSNCYNGCAQTTPDKCVKYTGVAVPELNIENGDTLFSVEDNIILKILSIIIGEAILPEVDPLDVCALIQGNLPLVTPYNLNDYLTAIIKSVCTQQIDLEIAINNIAAINSDYILDCITGVDIEDINNTHVVIQAIIDNFCDLKTTVEALALDLSTNYVKISDINSYIEAYITSTAPSTLISNKMVPFVAVEYYGTLANFNGSGAGIGDWAKIYLCNGANGTPDKRGRVPVGVTTVVGGGAYNPAVDPGNPDNPNYVLNTPLGSNVVTLTAAQMPPHTHGSGTLVTDPGHSHPNSTQNPANGSGSVYNYDSVGDREHYGLMNTNTATTGISVSVNIFSTGGGDAHSNIQPVLPCYYIMYIP